jgi:hypothetical protein
MLTVPDSGVCMHVYVFIYVCVHMYVCMYVCIICRRDDGIFEGGQVPAPSQLSVKFPAVSLTKELYRCRYVDDVVIAAPWEVFEAAWRRDHPTSLERRT